MTKLAIQIEPNSSLFNIVYTNQAVINKLMLPINKPINMSFGNKKIIVRLQVGSHKGSLLRVPINIANELLLPNGIELNATYKNEELKLGPILGILIQSIQQNQPKTPFGKFTIYAEELSAKALSNGIFPYFFTFNDINSEDDTVQAWFIKNNKWEKKSYPLPNVVYNRIASRSVEKKVLPLINLLKDKHKFIFFNDRFIDKWETYQILKPTPLKELLPKTIKYLGSRSLSEMLNTYSTIYLKPINGALGLGIFKVEKDSSQYKVQYSRMQGPTTLTFSSFAKMYKYLKPRLSSRPYLVQQGLDLVSLNNKRPIDFRILIQKNSKGDWNVISMVARMATDQNFVSNIAQGGTQNSVGEILKSLKLPVKSTRSLFRETALQIAKAIEKSLNGNFAELGIDLALDTKGKIWLLEVNSKPSKNDEVRESISARPSVTNLIKYVLHLSKIKKVRRSR